MTAITPAPESHASDALQFAVDAARCIGCVACLNVFPTLFEMDGEKARALGPAPRDEVAPGRVLQCCPVGAIRLVTPLPQVEPITRLDPVPGWEVEWEKHRNDPEDGLERERRYGRIYHVGKLGRCFLLRIELSRTLPLGDVLYEYGIPRHRPDYECSLHRVDPSTFSLWARLVDPRVRYASGKLNSFPSGFKVDYQFPEPVGEAYFRIDRDDVHVYAVPTGVPDALAALAATIREQLADE